VTLVERAIAPRNISLVISNLNYLHGSKNFFLILFFHGFMGNKDECYQIHNTALALVQWLDKLTIEKCFLVGYSMGGRLALYNVSQKWC